MSLVTVVWSMVASACFTLAVIYALVWEKNRAAWATLLFAVTAASAAGFTFLELRMMRAETPGEYLAALRWAHVPLFFWLVSITWFVWFYLGAGRLWLAWTISGLRVLALLLSFLVTPSLHYREIPSLSYVPFLGETVTVAEGIPNPWMLIGQMGALMLPVFVADAGITAWRRGDRRKALVIAGSVEFFLLTALGISLPIFWGGSRVPIVFGVLYLGLVAVMGYELSFDALRASRLVRELQASEAELREAEARMRVAVEAVNLGIWIRDLERNEIWASDSWRRLVGFGPSEPLQLDSLLQRMHPDDREAFRSTTARAVSGSNEGVYHAVYRLLLSDGACRWIESNGRVEFDAGGRPVLIRGTSRDVSESKRAEQETQLLRQEIAHVGRVTLMGQLASALAHELHQPLAAILRNAEAAELFLQHPTPDLDEIRAIFADIRADDERAAHVIDRMRDLLQRKAVDTGPLEVTSLVGDVAALVRVDAATRQVKVEVEVPVDLPQVRGNRVHLQQVLLNLILNGMDALDSAITEERRVRMTASLDGLQTVELAVVDSGHGIPAETIGRIFDPFFTTKSNGMGMGLAISRTIVEAHGGRLWAESRKGGGAEFRFTLPIAIEGAAE